MWSTGGRWLLSECYLRFGRLGIESAGEAWPSADQLRIGK